MTIRNATTSPRRARGLVASLSVAALTLTGMIAVPATAANPDKPKFETSFDRSRVSVDASKISSSLRSVDGQVTAFVQFRAKSAVDLDQAGKSRSAIRAQEKTITKIADQLVPAEASSRSSSSEPRQLAVTTNLVAGVMVIGDAAKIRKLAADDDVAAVYRVVPKKVLNKGTDSFTRALDTWQDTGLTGEGVRVEIIDTGLDYTHASFGGPGTPEAYAEAYGTDGTGPVPDGTFDAAKYKGGYDFAGPLYNAGSVPVPTPDDNPIDNVSFSANSGHGTHVAGTTAGYGVDENGDTFAGDYSTLTSSDVQDFLVGPGSAPEAELYALKVFGDAGGSTGLVIQALEWAADPNDDGDFNDRLDIVNLSLGSDGSPADDPENLFIDQLTNLGVLSVIASGNGGDLTDIGGSPGNANSALTVANSVGATQSFDAIEITDAPDDALEGQYAAQNSVNYAGDDDVTAEVAAAPNTNPGDANPFFSGCTAFNEEQAAAVDGKIAYLYWNDQDAVLECGSGVRFNNAQAAGAVGVLLSSQADVFSAGIAGNATIPGAQLTKSATEALQAAILAGGVFAHIGPSFANAGFESNPALGDLINSGSSRGVHGSLGIVKPDVAAPGTNISSAASGGGNAPSILTGTSMATPHVAGIAALVAQQHPDWSPVEVKQAVMNTATNDVYSGTGQSGPAWGPERVGSGRVDALTAVDTETLAFATQNPQGVSLTFGVVEVAEATVTLQETVSVRNLSSATDFYELGYVAASENPGAVVSVSPSSLEVPAGQTGLVTVTIELDRDALTRVTEPAQSTEVSIPGLGTLGRDFVSNVSGWLTVEPYDRDALRVPVHVAPKPVTDISGSDVALGESEAGALALTGRDVFQDGWFGFTAPLELVATSPKLETSGSVTSDSVIASGDIRFAGFASDVPAVLAGGGDLEDSMLSIGVATDGNWATLGSAMIPLVATDIDNDGTWDLETAVIKLDDAQDSLWALTFAVVGENPSTGELSWGDLLDYYPVNWGSPFEFSVFDSNAVVVPIGPAWVGIAEGDTPTFRVQTFSPYADADNGIIDEVSFTADPFAPNYVFSGDFGPQTHVFSEAGSQITVYRTENTPAEGQLLLLHTLNATGARAQVVDVTATIPEEPEPPVELADSSTKLVLKPSKSTYGTAVSAEVTVTSTGDAPTGTVTLTEGTKTLGTATVWTNGKTGKATIALPAKLKVGSHAIKATYSGNETVKTSAATATLKVSKVKTSVKVSTKSWKVKKNARPTITVTVSSATSAKATGKITVKVGKKTIKATLKNGKAKIKLPKIKKTTKVKVTYVGSSTHAKSSKSVIFKIKR
ncbi:MAG: S8 family serine peptidase [Actinomycetota bacterium]|nr:S8 family serine peptidase [Actinomycetota bacterium]